MRKYLLFLFIFICFTSSNGNQRLNRSPKSIKNLNQHDNDIRATSYRNESELLDFIESKMETYLIPGIQISVVKGGNIV